ncbi:MAG: hypothetical protein K8F91_15185 [Candidatus Obscuribacterales bacterium]|nr:hypothetical protein [Candidatus Obscuribacterales bacterium]
MPSQKILLIEDDLTLGELLVSLLEQTGHGVTWFVRARIAQDEFTEDGIVLMDADGKECKPDFKKFELALIDWRLKGSPINGPELIPQVVRAGLPVIGISGLSWLNEELIAVGARAAMVKDELMTRILRGELVIEKDFGL